MYCDKRVAVVVPARNEEDSLPAVLAGIPDFVDRIIVVNDGSTDGTTEVLRNTKDPRLMVARHEYGMGVGAALSTGYIRALYDGNDIVCVMGGDGQMDPADLPRLLDPIVREEADYVKGNRFADGVPSVMPFSRLVGNILLSLLSKFVTGYGHVFDSQCGYTAIRRTALERIYPHSIYRGYGVPNDILARLHRINAKVKDVPVACLYPKRHSQMKLRLLALSLPVLFYKLAKERLHPTDKSGNERPLHPKTP